MRVPSSVGERHIRSRVRLWNPRRKRHNMFRRTKGIGLPERTRATQMNLDENRSSRVPVIPPATIAFARG
jgi:hypothetical protein